MPKIFGLKSGAIVIGTDKGLLQIYVKNNKSIVTLEHSRNLVTYAKSFDMTSVISPFSIMLSKVLPNSLALKVIGHEFGKRERIILEDNNEKLMLRNEGIKKGRKSVTFSTYSNDKVRNLFDEYERNPKVFSGFCNYKIDSLGNIDDRELDLVKKMFTPKYTLKDLAANEKTHDALLKESATERYLDKIYKEYAKVHQDELDDIKKIGFKKTKNLFGEVNEALTASKKDDLIDTLERARTNIIARNAAIPNLMEYINDSRIEGNYTNEEVGSMLAIIYVKEKIGLYDVPASIEEKFKTYEIDEKLLNILEEDITRNFKKEDRLNFEDLLSIQFVRTRERITESSEEGSAKIDGVLKRYVDLLESVDYLGHGNDVNQSQKDELGVIIKNYENYLEEGVLSGLGISSGDGFITMFRNLIKTDIIRQKVDSDEIITFASETNNDDGINKVSEYNYIVKDENIYMFKDAMELGVMPVCDMKEKYSKYMESNDIKKSSLSKLSNKCHFIFLPEDNGIAQISREYQCRSIVDDTIYMIKTCETGKDIRRAGYLKDITANISKRDPKLSTSLDIDNLIYKKPAQDILGIIEAETLAAGHEGLELLSDEDLVVIDKLSQEIEEITKETDDTSNVGNMELEEVTEEPDMPEI